MTIWQLLGACGAGLILWAAAIFVFLLVMGVL